MSKKLHAKKSRPLPRKNVLLVVAVFAVIGTALFVFVRAATAPVTLEAESATRSGNATEVNDPAASGQKSLKFSTSPAGGGSNNDGNNGGNIGSGTVNCTGETPGPLRADKEFQGATTGVKVPYSIVLPDDYYTACKEYPVLYSLHGKTETNATFMDEALSIKQAVTDGVLPDVILVTPDSYSDGRWENLSQGPAEDNFIKELIPYIEKNYRVKKGASQRLLTGFSMGGHGAFRFAVKYPDMFAATLPVDGAFTYSPPDYTQYIDGVKTHKPVIYNIGGQLCGSRMETVLNAFKDQGITFPYVYYDREHVYSTFIKDDKNAGWPGVKTLANSIGRTIQ